MLSRLEESLIKKEETFCSNTYNPLPVVLKKGRGVYVWDVHCKKYCNVLTDISCLNVSSECIDHHISEGLTCLI